MTGSVPLRIIKELDPLAGGGRGVDQTTLVGHQPLIPLELRSIGASKTSCGSPDTRNDFLSVNIVLWIYGHFRGISFAYVFHN